MLRFLCVCVCFCSSFLSFSLSQCLFMWVCFTAWSTQANSLENTKLLLPTTDISWHTACDWFAFSSHPNSPQVCHVPFNIQLKIIVHLRIDQFKKLLWIFQHRSVCSNSRCWENVSRCCPKWRNKYLILHPAVQSLTQVVIIFKGEHIMWRIYIEHKITHLYFLLLPLPDSVLSMMDID